MCVFAVLLCLELCVEKTPAVPKKRKICRFYIIRDYLYPEMLYIYIYIKSVTSTFKKTNKRIIHLSSCVFVFVCTFKTKMLV